MKCIELILALVIAAAGCGHKSPEAAARWHGHSVFDTILTRQDVMEQVKQAERDLPGDVYRTTGEGTKMPMHWKDSRQTREVEVARELLRELQPSLRQMSVSELISAMKIYPVLSPDSPPHGVAYWLYGEGNQMIIDELKSRPVQQLKPLKKLARDKKLKFEVFLNESDSADLRCLCQEILEQKGVVIPDA
jgi:hypothetical protein